MAGRAYLFAVQDESGREVLSATIDGLERVSEVTASYEAGGTVSLNYGDLVVEQRPHDGDSVLTLHRWPAEDKSAKPVSHPVR